MKKEETHYTSGGFIRITIRDGETPEQAMQQRIVEIDKKISRLQRQCAAIRGVLEP